MAMLEIYLLGAPRIIQNGLPVVFDTRKATALLAYLSVTSQPHTRDALATLLWPDYDQSHSKAALRRTLSVIRKGIGHEFLDTQHDSVLLVKGAGVSVDAIAFHELLETIKEHQHTQETVCPECHLALTSAAEIYQDDFLAGFGLRDSNEFDDWMFFQSEELRRELAWTLELLSSTNANNGDYELAISNARRWLSLDPLREEAHRQLMLVYAWAGQRNAAIRQYRDCVRILEQELGVAPLDETTQLYQEILGNRVSPQHKHVSQINTQLEGVTAGPSKHTIIDTQRPLEVEMLSRTDFTLPMIGRSRDWEALLLCHNAAKRNGWVVVIDGEAGIGKTRLVNEFSDYARSQGSRVFQARCYEGETHLAYGPFYSGLEALLRADDVAERLGSISAHWLIEAAQLQPEIYNLVPGLPMPPSLDSPGAQGRFFEGLRQVLCELLNGQAPGVMVLDDLHWADAASLDLLMYILHRLEQTNLLILFTWPEGAIETNPRILQLLVEAQRTRRSTYLHLERLNAEQVDQLVRQFSDFPISHVEEFSQKLYQESEGLPLFTVAYLNATQVENQPRLESGLSLPSDIRNLLLARISLLDEGANQLIGTAAVIGRSFDYSILREVSGRSEAETVKGLETLLAHRLISENKHSRSNSDTTYDFTHEKLRELVYKEIIQARRQLLHRRVAEALLNSPQGRRDPAAIAGMVAYHFQHGGQGNQASEYYRLAGDRSRSLYANETALSHYQAALAAGPADAAALYEAIGDLQTLLGDYEDALISLERAAALGVPDALAGIEVKLGNIHHRRGEFQLAICHFQSALDAMGVSESPVTKSLLFADWSRSAQQFGEIEQAVDLAHQALQLANAAADSMALAKAHNILGILARNRQDLTMARQHLEKSLAYAEQSKNPEARIAALNNLGLVYAESDQLDTAIDYAQEALETCVKIGDRHRSAALYNHLADLYHRNGESGLAMDCLKTAVTIFGEIDDLSSAPNPHIWMLIEW